MPFFSVCVGYFLSLCVFFALTVLFVSCLFVLFVFLFLSCLFVRLLRWDFELYRFDLVRYVNQLDSKKVVLLETGINRAFYGKHVKRRRNTSML